MLAIIPTYDDKGEILDTVSAYKPDQKTQDRIVEVQNDFAIADLVRNRTYSQFNWDGYDTDLISYMNEMQMRFNNTPPPHSDDPNENWRSNRVQPMTRNKVIGIMAGVTNAIMKPKAVAQNSSDEEDLEAARAMEDLIQYTHYKTDYDDKFLMAVQEMCTSPGVIVRQDYANVKRKMKKLDASGGYVEEECQDEVLSGFQMGIIPMDEFYISNAYEPNLQKQDFIIWRKAMTYNQARMEAKDSEGFLQYVSQGNRLYFNYENSTFFEQMDDFLDGRLVFRDIYYHRRKDLQLTFYNGWLDGNINAPYHRADTPILRKDKKYPFAKSGYERYDSRFFYHMPLTAKLAGLQDEIDNIHRALTDGTILSIFPPLNVTGAEEGEVAAIKPGAMNSFTRPDTTVSPMVLGQNLQAGYNLLSDQRRAADESSQSPRAAGFSEGGRETLGEVQMLQQNTEVQLGLIGKMIAKLVRDYGDLLVSSILQHLTVGTYLEVVSQFPKIKYNKFIIPDVERYGNKKTSVVEFVGDEDMPTSEEEELAIAYNLLSLEKKKNQTIWKINANTFRDLQFSLIVEATLENKQASFSKRIFAFDRLKHSELVNQRENLKHNLIEPLHPGESDRFLKDEAELQMEAAAAGMTPQNKRPVGRPPNPEQEPMEYPQLES